ncbi:bacteriohemerythrin [Variovorax sp. VNK109]|jgi:hemerythrin|uniref:bacteriohemerythrin n=1 Tax=Variovorax sp. VNK109 TaxID=3400919 RepID=UPI003C001B41
MNHPLTLGDSVLDEDHLRLEDLVLQLRDAPLDEVSRRLEAVREHASRHFALEDIELRAMADGNAKCHLDEHAAVLNSLDEVMVVLTQVDVAAEKKALLINRLATELHVWLPGHVHEMDAGVASHRSKQRFGGAPVKIARRPGT